MKLTGKSKYLLSFFLQNKTINNSKHSNKTDSILLTLYNELLDAHKYLLEIENYIPGKSKVGDKKVIKLSVVILNISYIFTK